MASNNFSLWIRINLLPYIGYMVIHLVFVTIRMRFFNDRFVWNRFHDGQSVIFAFWHNRLAYMPYAYTRRFRRKNLVTMISRSKDGRLVGRICELFGLHVAYGSSSRGGSEALREMIRMAKEKSMDCGITPDGPRGPKYVVQPGIISVAQQTGLPIVPICYDVRHKIKLKSWDGFYVPIPFTSGAAMFGEPIYVPETVTASQRDELLGELQHRLNGICAYTRSHVDGLCLDTITE